jgi:L-histidine N-alpha-methyltransferase
MKILMVTPAPPRSRKGNRVTAERWARCLRQLGHRVALAEEFSAIPNEPSCDLMIALHARRSYPSIQRFRRQHPHLPLIVALTGTDLYHDIHTSKSARQSLEMATRLIVLQPKGIAELPAHLRAKTRVIYQSIHKPARTAQPRKDVFEVGVFGHLRSVKDPFRAAMAARLLPPSSRLRVLHAGAALDKSMERRARAEELRNPRYQWLGELPRPKALRLLARCRAMILSSRLEGGANVLSESIVLGVPALASRIAGSVGLLGPDYPGYFKVGDTRALARLMERAERDPGFLRALRKRIEPLRPLFHPARERKSWKSLLQELKLNPRARSGTAASAAVPAKAARFTLIDYGREGSQDRAREEFAREVKAGLLAKPKRLSCRFFYDRRGSLLFEKICELPEYYLMRAERAILERNAKEIAGLFPHSVTLVELGSGNASKTRILIREFIRRRAALRYVPVDISRAMLEESSRDLLKAFPSLQVMAISGEYNESLQHLHAEKGRAKLILWLGSNVGNFDRNEAARFLGRVRATMGRDDRFLAGIDLRKSPAVLEAAYDDRAGVTAQFNKNILARINRELGGHFDLDSFQHVAVYKNGPGRIEIYLASLREQRVRIDALGLEISFQARERVHTENSYKYSLEEIEALASAAGFRLERQWLDRGPRFSVNLLAPAR